MSSADETRRAVPSEEGALVDGWDARSVVPYDENLLEQARTQWQFGDWQSLLMLERETLQHHPERAKLALLAASGHLQSGGLHQAREFVRLARDWGCSDRLVMQVLAAGVHNSLGRAAVQAGQHSRAFKHFEDAIRLGVGGTDARLMARARAREQFDQLGYKMPEKLGDGGDHKGARDVAVSLKLTDAALQSPIPVELFRSEREEDRARALATFRAKLEPLWSDLPVPELAWLTTSHRDKTYFFVHFSGDYIPAKMAEKGQFYESPFLNLLARLHQPGKLIVDGGANIGNHTVFFAAVMGAPVVAFEPQPSNCQLLTANVHLNGLAERVDVRRVALGDQPGRISLVQALDGNHGSFTSDRSLVRRAEGDAQSVTAFDVPLSTLDAELASYVHRVSIIKLDLEGMELDALRGARAVIGESLPVIAVECFTQTLFLQIKEFLAGFEYFAIDSTNATPTFIFLTLKNPRHQQLLARYLEMSSVGKFASNPVFKETTK